MLAPADPRFPPSRGSAAPVSGPHPWEVRATPLPSRATVPRRPPAPLPRSSPRVRTRVRAAERRSLGPTVPARPRAATVFPPRRGLTPGRAVSRTHRPRKQTDGRSARGTHQEVLMSNPARALGRVAPYAAPVGPSVPAPAVPPPGAPRARRLRARRPGAGTPRGDGAAPTGSGGRSPVRGPQCPGPERGGACVRSRRDTPGAPRRRDGQEGHEGPVGRTGGPATGGGGHAPPRTAGTPRA